MKTLLVLGLVASGLSAAVFSGPAGAKSPPPNGLEPIGTELWPSVAAQLAKNIARASFAHEYDQVWGYLHPTHQQAVAQSRWHRCQRSHPAAPRDVTIQKVAVASAYELAIDLPLLGRRNVQQLEVRVQFKTPARAGPQFAILYTFWLKQGKTWTAVWSSDEYQSYKAGKCYLTPQGPPLY